MQRLKKLVRARVAQWQRNRFVIGRLVGSTPLSGCAEQSQGFWGEVPEWLIGTVCKTVALTGYTGSNPVLSTTLKVNIGLHRKNLYNILGIVPT